MAQARNGSQKDGNSYIIMHKSTKIKQKETQIQKKLKTTRATDKCTLQNQKDGNIQTNSNILKLGDNKKTTCSNKQANMH